MIFLLAHTTSVMKLIWLHRDSLVIFILIPHFLSFMTNCDKENTGAV